MLIGVNQSASLTSTSPIVHMFSKIPTNRLSIPSKKKERNGQTIRHNTNASIVFQPTTLVNKFDQPIRKKALLS